MVGAEIQLTRAVGWGAFQHHAIAIVFALKPPVHKSGRTGTRALDQFYTRPAVAGECVARVLAVIGHQVGTVFIEPAAGAGSFLDALPTPRIGLDIAPTRADIERADFAFQRVGVRAGLVSVEWLARAAQSHYFIAVRNRTRDVAAILALIDWSGVKSRTAGNPSIGKAKLVAAYQARIAQSGLASTNGHRRR